MENSDKWKGVAESGTHEMLMKKNGLYTRLVKLQMDSAEWKLGKA